MSCFIQPTVQNGKKKDIEFIIIEEGNTETVKLYLKNGLLKIVKCKFSINSQIN